MAEGKHSEFKRPCLYLSLFSERDQSLTLKIAFKSHELMKQNKAQAEALKIVSQNRMMAELQKRMLKDSQREKRLLKTIEQPSRNFVKLNKSIELTKIPRDFYRKENKQLSLSRQKWV